MFPTLFKFGPLSIHSYGVLLAFSFLLGIKLASVRAEKAGLDPKRIADLVFYMLLPALLGARLLYVFLNFSQYRDNLWSIVNPFQGGEIGIGGLVLHGGLVGGLVAVFSYIRIKRMPVLKTLDVLAPTFPLGIFITRIGCFLSGCCYGKPTQLPWGVIFPEHCSAGYYQHHELSLLQPIHPTQLYDSLFGLITFALLLWLEKKYKKFDGFTTCLMFILYPAFRFINEFFRQFYDERGLWAGFTHNQYLTLILMVSSSVFLFYLFRKQEKPLTS